MPQTVQSAKEQTLTIIAEEHAKLKKRLERLEKKGQGHSSIAEQLDETMFALEQIRARIEYEV